MALRCDVVEAGALGGKAMTAAARVARVRRAGPVRAALPLLAALVLPRSRIPGSAKPLPTLRVDAPRPRRVLQHHTFPPAPRPHLVTRNVQNPPMSLPEPSDLPSSFDPALFLHSEEPDAHLDATLPTSTHSDEFEALQLLTKETTAAKTEAGVVIQHRAWRVPEVFRSEEDHLIDTPVKRQQWPHDFSITIEPTSSPRPPPSSPPLAAMPLISSPVAYPASSSPAVDSPRKRRRIEGRRDPLHDVSASTENKMVGGFLADDSDEEEDYAAIKAAHNKRKATAVNLFKQFTVDQELSVENDRATQSDEALPAPSPVGVDGDRIVEPPRSQPIMISQSNSKVPITLRTCSGRSIYVAERRPTPPVPYEQLVASRSTTKAGKARKSYYGIDIHSLMDEATKEAEEETAKRQQMDVDRPMETVEDDDAGKTGSKSGRALMWTEKYRAKKFTDLVGDERTHRSVLRWLKAWDPIVFPGSSRPKPKVAKPFGQADADEEYFHRKILLLTGPPGLGKTTLAHVCARQAGYEVQEINASDERSKDVVKGRIRDMVGTENVRGVDMKTATGAKVRKAGKPVCVVVDEVDGVVGGSSGGGEGGFIKALIDLVHLDQKNSGPKTSETSTTGRKKKGDKFRLLRPLVLICNDVYHPSLRPLRQSTIAEIIHIRKPPLNMVVPRLHSIFEKEGIPADADGVRRLCEATWGISSRKDGGGGGTGEGDVRGVMVVGEWVARKLLAETTGNRRLTRKWIEDNIINDLSHGGGAARGLGRGGAKEVVERVFKDGAGFPKSVASAYAESANIGGGSNAIGVAESAKRFAMDRLREMVNTAGETDRIVTDCFTTYANQPFQDDTLLSKPTSAYSWLHFHDCISSAVHTGQEWELAAYLSTPVLAFHDLFASSIRPSLGPSAFSKGKAFGEDGAEDAEPAPFSGPSAPYQMIEQRRANLAALTSMQSGLSLPLTRMYRSPAEISTELIPYVLRMLSPDVKPVIINTSSASGTDKSKTSSTASVRKASEKALVMHAVNTMTATGVRFEKSRVEFATDARNSTGYIYRMEPPLDALARFETMGAGGQKDDKVRYAVRQILDAEFKKESVRLDMETRKRRGGVVELEELDGLEKMDLEEVAAAAEKKVVVKKDFFGRVIAQTVPMTPVEKEKNKKKRQGEQTDEGRVWVSFHEGFSNAVRKPVTLAELLGGL